MNTTPSTIAIISLGCSKNRVDSEHLLGMMKERGYIIVTDLAKADILIVNTCGFIEPAKVESIDTIFELAQYKEKGAARLLIVTGCLSERYGEELRAEIPEIDILLGVSDYSRIFDAIDAALVGKHTMCRRGTDGFMDGARVLTTPAHSAYVKISDGCDNRCSYCAIPLIRGGYRSRPFDSIVAECETLSQGGASELTLIAQDTSRYGSDFSEKKLLLPDLLKRIHAIDRVHWLRVLYCYPDTVDERLLDTIASLPKACNYLDLPLQHINADLLKKMNRRGTPSSIRRLISMCKERDIAVRTTMIVGFPGETDAQFQELLDFVRESRFARLGAFTYSPEEDTPAGTMPGQIDDAVKTARLDQLMSLQQGISLELNESRIGKEYEVLIEGEENGAYYGRSPMEAPEVDGIISFPSEKELNIGTYIRVRITEADAYDLHGEVIK